MRRYCTRCCLWVLLGFVHATGVQAQQDTVEIYRKIHDYSDRHKLTRWIYSGIFVPPKSAPEPPASAPVTVRVDPFQRDAGKVVRRIAIRTFDPFGYSVDDTALAPVNRVQRIGNDLHRKTRQMVVRNLLLVKPGQHLDPLKVSESERVLRTQPFVNDARILVQPAADAPDSVDLLVLVHDKWSIDGSGQASLNSASGTLQERNFLGYGQRIEQGLGYTLGQPKLSASGTHQVYNIGQSHISSTLSYSLAPGLNSMGANLQRPFYSPLAKWAGGATWGQSWSPYITTDSAGSIVDDRVLSPVSLDLWAAKALRLGNGLEPGSENSNFVLAARYAQTRYATRPPPQLDPQGLHRSSSLFLASAGLSIRQYYKERYLYRFGNAEDVPEGLLITLAAGMERLELTPVRPYFGATASRGRNYPHLGYLSIGLGYGTFLQAGQQVDGAANASLLWFSDLKALGRWHFRQFVRFNSTYGIVQPVFQRVNLGGDQLYGFPGSGLSGTHKELLRSETVFYAPWNLLGFKIAPVFLAGFGTLGQQAAPLFSGRVYSSFTLGLLVRNENLLVSTFQLSVGFFPDVPTGQAGGFLFNVFDAFSAGTAGFDFGEPSVVSYQ